MAKFKSEIDLVDLGSGSYTLDYNIFSPGRKYEEVQVNITQVDAYNSETKAIPGVKIEIKFDDLGPGNPLTNSGSVPITTPYIISAEKPFVEVVYLAWDNATQMYKDKGGAIVRGQLPS